MAGRLTEVPPKYSDRQGGRTQCSTQWIRGAPSSESRVAVVWG